MYHTVAHTFSDTCGPVFSSDVTLPITPQTFSSLDVCTQPCNALVTTLFRQYAPIQRAHGLNAMTKRFGWPKWKMCRGMALQPVPANVPSLLHNIRPTYATLQRIHHGNNQGEHRPVGHMPIILHHSALLPHLSIAYPDRECRVEGHVILALGILAKDFLIRLLEQARRKRVAERHVAACTSV
jgi:hypothetical protein